MFASTSVASLVLWRYIPVGRIIHTEDFLAAKSTLFRASHEFSFRLHTWCFLSHRGVSSWIIRLAARELLPSRGLITRDETLGVISDRID